MKPSLSAVANTAKDLSAFALSVDPIPEDGRTRLQLGTLNVDVRDSLGTIDVWWRIPVCRGATGAGEPVLAPGLRFRGLPPR